MSYKIPFHSHLYGPKNMMNNDLMKNNTQYPIGIQDEKGVMWTHVIISSGLLKQLVSYIFTIDKLI